MQTYWLGLDAGGTGSTFTVTDHQLNEVFRMNGGPIQARKMPFEAQIETISNYVDAFDEKFGLENAAGFGLGIAGLGRVEDRIPLQQEMAKRWPGLKVILCPDSEIAHIGAFANNDGILVITGTGSIVWARRGNAWFRAGGLGSVIGDEGSGMKLGAEGLAAAGFAWDGGETTLLCQLLSEKFGISSNAEMVKAVYDQQFAPSRAAVAVLEAAAAGDKPCREIARRQAGLLARQVAIVANRFNADDRTIVLWGGLQKNDFYHETLTAALHDACGSVSLSAAKYEPCTGACILAQTHFGQSSSPAK